MTRYHWMIGLIVAMLLSGCSGGNLDMGAANSTSVASAPAPTVSSQSAPTAVADEVNTFSHIHHFSGTSPSGYAPAQILAAYGFNQLTTLDGSNQIIAIIDAYGSPTAKSDFATFCTQYGLPQTAWDGTASLTVFTPQGAPSTNAGWALETSLDIEWAHVIAPKAKIYLVEARTSSFSNLLPAVSYAVNTLHAQQVSMSWGGGEFSGESSDDSYFNQAGVSFFASSGDSGSGTIYPAVSPFVTAVGGTTLNLSPSSETAWSGSGGGSSKYETVPAYQSTSTAASLIGANRGVPDIAYNGNPNTGFAVYDTTRDNGKVGWFQVGGTSCGAPQWAALCALANQARQLNGKGPFGAQDNPLNSALYATPYPYLSDIISGGNGGFTCQSGWDFVTGWGSPIANQLVPYLGSR